MTISFALRILYLPNIYICIFQLIYLLLYYFNWLHFVCFEHRQPKSGSTKRKLNRFTCRHESNNCSFMYIQDTRYKIIYFRHEPHS